MSTKLTRDINRLDGKIIQEGGKASGIRNTIRDLNRQITIQDSDLQRATTKTQKKSIRTRRANLKKQKRNAQKKLERITVKQDKQSDKAEELEELRQSNTRTFNVRFSGDDFVKIKERNGANVEYNLPAVKNFFFKLLADDFNVSGNTRVLIYRGRELLTENVYNITTPVSSWFNSNMIINDFTEGGSDAQSIIQGDRIRIITTDLEDVEERKIKQYYLDGKNIHCFFEPIICFYEKKLKQKHISSKTKSNYKCLMNKAKRCKDKYSQGICETDIKKECLNLDVNVNIVDSFNKTTFSTGYTYSVRHTFNYVNTRVNHLELSNNDNEIVEIESMDGMDKLLKQLDNHNEYYVFKRNRQGITKIITTGETYVFKSKINEIIQEFNEKTELDRFSIFHKENEKMSNFVLNGTHLTNAINFKPYDEEIEMNHIDQEKSYLQFKNCGYYKEFPTIFTNFRKLNMTYNKKHNTIVDKIRQFLKKNVGFYQIKNIKLNKIKDDNTKKVINKLIEKGYIRDYIILPSVELEYLMDLGIQFDLLNGLWCDKTIDISDEHIEIIKEKVEGRRGNMISPYALWAGISCSFSKTQRYYINTDKEVAMTMKATGYKNMFYDETNNMCIINVEKDVISHKSHIGAFIFSYQRINLIQQLCKIDCDNIVRVVLDGIFYQGEQPELFNKFRVKEGKFCVDESKFINKLTRIDTNEKFDLSRYTSNDNKQLNAPLGAGGNGKTHTTMMNNKDLQILYVAPSYTLCRGKENEFKDLMLVGDVFENLYKGKKWTMFHKDYPIVVIDEITMLTEEKKQYFINMFPYSKLYFCGDLEKVSGKTITFQLPPIQGKVMSLDGLNTYTYKTNYRFKAKDPIRKLVSMMRGDIRKGRMTTKFGNFMKKNNRVITKEELKELYNIEDYVLCARRNCNKCKGECVCGTNHVQLFNNLLGDKGDKYLITKNGKNYSNGDIVYELPKGVRKNFEFRHAFTNHQTQGKTIRNSKIFIYGKELFDVTMAYVAVSRATCLDQIYLIID